MTFPWPDVERLLELDPAGRGVPRLVADLPPNQLRKAAESLAMAVSSVGIVTGFSIVLEDRVTAETDGPPGALLLAKVLRELGREVLLITDQYGAPLLECGCDLLGLPRKIVRQMPIEDVSNQTVENLLLDSSFGLLGHLVSIERAGPSHTLESLARQAPAGSARLEMFLGEVPTEQRGICHNMRGEPIEQWTAPCYRLFELTRERRLPLTMIGVGDGGNEIGFGNIAWERLRETIPFGSRIACRTRCDYTLLAGVSDWGAYALAAGVCSILGKPNLLAGAVDQQSRLLKKLVTKAGAVDGMTRQAEPTVDGLSQDVYLAPLEEITGLLHRG